MSTRPDEDPPIGSAAAWSLDGRADVDEPADAARYARGGELGRGGMGVVEAAVDTWLDRDVAIKRPRPDRPAEHVARLMREARITARLVHPAIPPVYDVGEDAQGPYYTMPVLVGATLHDAVAAGATLRVVVDAVATASRAAGYAHARGVVHRDLKPANVLLGAFGEVWVVDWGVALDPARPDTGVVGTPGFQAPEQVRGEPVTPAADVYALGRTLEAALVGREAPALRAIVARATASSPGDRYADGAALADDLARWLDGRLVEAHRYPAGELVRHLAWRWRTPLAALAAAAVVGAVLGVGALRAQAAERARADASLSASLAQQAAAYGRQDARAEAEVLAAHSLLLAENPLARGVLMAWDAGPSPALVSEGPLACERPFVEEDGHLLCVDDLLRVVGPDGVQRWSAPLAAAPDGEWVGQVAELRRAADGTVLVRRSTNRIEVWRDGRLVRAHPQHFGALGLAEGPVAAVHDQRRVGLIGVDGEIGWGPEVCERIELALVRPDATVVGCRESRVWVEAGEDVPGSPSALAWADGPIVGTFEGGLLTRGEGGWSQVEAGVGAVRQLVPLAAGRLAVVGERGQVRLWDLARRAWVGQLPRGGVAVARVGEDLVVYGDTVRRYALPTALRPVVFDRREEGGISAFDLSPSGARVVAGSASGEVVVWDAATGAASRELPPAGAAAKGVRFLDDDAFVYAVADAGMWRRTIGGESTFFSKSFTRAARHLGGELVMMTWSPRVAMVGADGERSLPLPTRALAATWAGSLWVADERGEVYEARDDAFEPRFKLASPTGGLAASGDLLVAVDGASVEARTHTGEMVWRWTGSAALSSLDATDAWVAAGDVDGRVLLLRPDGRLVAGVAGHGRRVADVLLRDDRLYSGSWDGTVRVWGLAAAEASPASLALAATRRWGLTLDDVLADPVNR